MWNTLIIRKYLLLLTGHERGAGCRVLVDTFKLSDHHAIDSQNKKKTPLDPA